MKLIIRDTESYIENDHLEGRYVKVLSTGNEYRFFTNKGRLVSNGTKYFFQYFVNKKKVQVVPYEGFPENFIEELTTLVTLFTTKSRTAYNDPDYYFPKEKHLLHQLQLKYRENPCFEMLRSQGYVSDIEDYESIFSLEGTYVTQKDGTKRYKAPKRQVQMLVHRRMAEFPTVEDYLCLQINEKLYPDSRDYRKRLTNQYAYGPNKRKGKPIFKDSVHKGYYYVFRHTNTRKKVIVPRGYIQEAIDFFSEYKNYQLEIIDERTAKYYVPEEFQSREYLNSLARELEGFDLYDSQYDAIMSVVNNIESLSGCFHLNLATNSGKTIILGILSKIIKRVDGQPLRVAFMNSYSVLEAKTVDDYISQGFDVSVIAASSTKTAISKFLLAKAQRNDNSFDYTTCSEAEKKKRQRYLKTTDLYKEPQWNTAGDFCVVMIRSFMTLLKKVKSGKMDKEDLPDLTSYDITIWDEGDAVNAYDINILDYLSDNIRILASGTSTEHGNAKNRMKSYAVFGRPTYTITSKENRESGSSSKAYLEEVEWFVPEHSAHCTAEDIFMSETLIELVMDVLDKTKENDGQTLLYFGKQNHKFIDEFAEELKRREVKCITLHTMDSAKEKAEKIDKMITRQENILLASSVVSRGLNIKQISDIIYLLPTYSPSEFLQVIGRGDRLGSNKDEYKIWFFRYRSGRFIDYANSYRYLYTKEEYGIEIVNNVVE